jgi:UDP-GlcNAc:undecaprenyl-phosphate/decaprenyl-phosphate GlcNAc-1-phosphate transferase
MFLLPFFLAFALTFGCIPVIIRIARARNLFDQPNERSAHLEVTPRLGGIGIFIGLSVSLLVFCCFSTDFWTILSLFLAFSLVFAIGISDDLMPILPRQKVLIQVLATCFLMFGAGVRVTSFYGLFGVDSLPLLASAGLTIFIVIAVVNAFNLIDGINGLAGCLAAFLFSFFGSWFLRTNQADFAFVAFAFVGAAMAFLWFNLRTKAQIFMGDSGSLLLGFAVAALGIQFLETGFDRASNGGAGFSSVLGVGVSLLIVPLFDMSRLFFQRILNGKSPFLADRNHLHHLLLDCEFTHLRATAFILGFNGILVLLVLFFQQKMDTIWLILGQILIVSSISMLVFRAARRRRLELLTREYSGPTMAVKTT